MKYIERKTDDEITQTLLIKALSNIFESHVRILTVNRMTLGVENYVFHILTEEEGRLRDYILKISCQERFRASRLSLIQREFLVRKLLGAGIPVPNIISYHEVDDSYYVLLLEYINGQPCLPNTSQIKLIAEMLCCIQTIPINDEFKEHMYADCFHDFRGEKEEFKVLVHGDYHLGNLLWNNELLCGIVDWDTVRIGYPEEDVAHCFIDILVLTNKDLANFFLQICSSLLHLNQKRLKIFLSADAHYTIRNYHKWVNGFFGKARIIDDETLEERLIPIADT